MKQTIKPVWPSRGVIVVISVVYILPRAKQVSLVPQAQTLFTRLGKYLIKKLHQGC